MLTRKDVLRGGSAVLLMLAGFAGSGPATAQEPIVVGAPIPVTGPFASDGIAMKMGLDLAVEEINGRGGLLGRPLKLVEFDIGDLTPDKLEAAGTNLVSRNNAAVLINGYGGMGPDIPAFCAYPVPYINNNATSNVVPLRNQMECGNIFMGSDVDSAYAKATFQQILDLGYAFPSKTVAIVHGPYDWELNSAQGIREAAEAAGWEVVIDEEVPYDNRQWSGVLSQIKAEEPGLVFFELLDTAGVSSFVDQFLVDPPKTSLLYAGYIFSTPAFQEIVAGGGANGVLGMTVSAQLPGAKGEAFVAAWEKKHGAKPPFSIGAAIYDELMLWAAAVEKVGSVDDYAAINEAIRGLAYEGVTGVYRFNEEQYVPVADDTLPSHLIQAQDGRHVQLKVGSQKVGDFKVPAWIAP
ncbi:ABC transporter substrate-binding protein [Chthonobacter albigriseus]|uniref:ABC transporter substrate-binding protein n=1 Tax=Chthonobacter albigriseus TaxID=1683161 RepID=UPI0015EE5619|nr:ABC transporter substrate-binding protein [Chthonobacter albigriseus]